MQRPFVLETVSLDLHLARGAGLFIRALNPESAKRIDVVSLLDEFAANFYRELDYELECANPNPNPNPNPTPNPNPNPNSKPKPKLQP